MGRLEPGWDVIVVGGGLAGLAAGACAARSGARTLVLERAGAPGGRARTVYRDGYHLNQGPHALYRSGAAAGVLRELGVRYTGHPPPTSGGFAIREQRLHTLPIGPVSLLTTGLLELRGRLEFGSLLGSLPRLDTRPLDGVSLGQWLESRRLSQPVAALLRALVRLSCYASEPARQSAGAALDQLRLGASGGVLYLDRGWQTLVEGLAGALRGAGGELRWRSPAVELERDDAGFRLWLRDGRRLTARVVILALPPLAAARLLGGGAGAWLERQAAARPAVRAATLEVALRRLPRPHAVFAIGVDRPEYFSVHSAAARLAPEGGALVHAARYLGDQPAPASTEADLEGLLELLQPGWRSEVVVRRFVPELTVSHALVTAAGGGSAGRPGPGVPAEPGLFLAGDWVGPEGMLADASLASARAAAGAALRALAERGAAA